MRTFFSYLGLILLAIGLIFLGGDMMTTLEHQGDITLHSYSAIWAMFDPGAVAAFTAWMTRALPGFLTSAVQGVLSVPALATGFVGVIIAFLAGHQRKQA
jgi:hypothetical protein